MFQKKYRRNIILLGGLDFLSFFGITTFWVLFLSQNGMSLLEVGLLESLFHGTSILFEIPSGMLADRFTYKTNLYISRVMTILSSLLMILGQGNFWIYAIAMILTALGYNFSSGTDSAMLFESAKEAGLESRYLKITSVIAGFVEAGLALGSVLASFFVHGLLYYTYYIMIVLSLIGIGLIYLMKEPQLKAKEGEQTTLKSIVSVVSKEFKEKPGLLFWMLSFQFVASIMCMFYFYYQNELPDLTVWQISFIMLLGSVINVLAVWLASRIGEKWHSRRIFPILVFLTGLSFVFAITGNIIFYALIYLFSNGLYALFLPIFNNDLQHNLPSEVRATLLSVNAMCFSLSMIIVFPFTGWLIDNCGFARTFILLGLLLVLLAPILYFKNRDVIISNDVSE
ncbi:MFS transporter [Streptococcus sp. CSL10205-OR2]|uniref:MFS transporter n=1 Tax=Streptococcus sp. CSL10205-OR2 TaxID=2980558 RepID=UPI0021D8ED94|nr:MFS transporter [Streptococcus sp. CSL10205-OR2]MCU9534325.1 MFS transporter [Streptococcus sp. CSL10205-OR2]